MKNHWCEKTFRGSSRELGAASTENSIILFGATITFLALSSLGVAAADSFWNLSFSFGDQQEYLTMSDDGGVGAGGYWDSGDSFSEGGGSWETVDEVEDPNEDSDRDDDGPGGSEG